MSTRVVVVKQLGFKMVQCMPVAPVHDNARTQTGQSAFIKEHLTLVIIGLPASKNLPVREAPFFFDYGWGSCTMSPFLRKRR